MNKEKLLQNLNSKWDKAISLRGEFFDGKACAYSDILNLVEDGYFDD